MNFKWNPEKCTLLLVIPRPDIDSRIISYAHEHGYVEKQDFHITILSFQNGKKLIQQLPPEELENIVTLAHSYAWNYELVSNYFSLERTINEFVLHGQVQTPEHTRRTIIQKVIVDDLATFLKDLSSRTGVLFDEPFPHVTLFSWSDYEPLMKEGIGLNSESDFEKYNKGEIVV